LIEIEFDQGYGLQPTDSLRFRGIEIGRVEKIDLRPNPPGVVTMVRLTPAARTVVTEGTRFWIARPVVSLESIQGLETVIGPKYIAMEPGRGSIARGRRFIGMEAPPPIDPKEGAIEIILDSQQRHGLSSGTPILHRGFRVGDVLSVELASDARSVIMRSAIDPEYQELVRGNSRFWVRSGWRFEMGLRGINIVADSIGEILYGGIEFATPDANASIATPGARFQLFDEPEKEWLEWQPSLPYGAGWDKLRDQSYQSHRVVLRFQEKSFGFTVDRQRSGWGLLLDDGHLVCRDDLGIPPQGALGGSAAIEFLGSNQAPADGIASSPLSDGRRLVKLPLLTKEFHAAARFKSKNIPLDSEPRKTAVTNGRKPVDVLVLGPEPSKGIALDSGRLISTQQGWEVDSKIPISPDLDSAPVLESSTGRCIGCLSIQRGVAVIGLLPYFE
jgi:hypothetical protein